MICKFLSIKFLKTGFLCYHQNSTPHLGFLTPFIKIFKKFPTKLLQKPKQNCKFATADRLSEAPVWGKERRESANALKQSALENILKAFI